MIITATQPDLYLPVQSSLQVRRSRWIWSWACCDQTLNGGGGSYFQVSDRHDLLTSTDYLGPRFLDLNPNTEADEFGLQKQNIRYKQADGTLVQVVIWRTDDPVDGGNLSIVFHAFDCATFLHVPITHITFSWASYTIRKQDMLQSSPSSFLMSLSPGGYSFLGHSEVMNSLLQSLGWMEYLTLTVDNTVYSF